MATGLLLSLHDLRRRRHSTSCVPSSRIEQPPPRKALRQVSSRGLAYQVLTADVKPASGAECLTARLWPRLSELGLGAEARSHSASHSGHLTQVMATALLGPRLELGHGCRPWTELKSRRGCLPCALILLFSTRVARTRMNHAAAVDYQSAAKIPAIKTHTFKTGSLTKSVFVVVFAASSAGAELLGGGAERTISFTTYRNRKALIRSFLAHPCSVSHQ